MSLAYQSQQWNPSIVQVTVLQARGLRIKGKNGTNNVYAVMQVVKEKFSTSVVENTVSPMWKEEATFELPLFHYENEERCTLQVHIMHRSVMGPDKLLGRAVINLLEFNEVKSRNKTEWFRLLDKAGKLDKDRGEVLLDIKFMRNNMTASMFDLSATNKPRSRLGKFKDKVRGKKKEGLSDSASTVVPSFSQVLTDSEEEAAGGREGGADKDEKKKKHKLKSLFSPKTNLQRNMSQSMSVLGPLPERNTALSGSRSSGLNIDSSEGKKKFKFLTHKRTGSSDSKGHPDSLSLPGHSKPGSVPAAEQSNLCVNGSHVYKQEPQPRSARAGSTFSVASSGLGSMEDLHKPQGHTSSNASTDSLRALWQSSVWAEEGHSQTADVEEEEVEEQQGIVEESRKAEEDSMIHEEQERMRKVEEEDPIQQKELESSRLEGVERICVEGEKRKKTEEEKRRVEEERILPFQEQEQLRIDTEKMAEEERKKRLLEVQKRARQEAEDMERLEEKRRAEEQKMWYETERIRREKEVEVKKEEEVKTRRAEQEERERREKEVERVRREEEEEKRSELEKLRRTREEEERRKIEEERIRREESEERRKVEEERMRREEAEERRRREEAVEEERRREEEEERRRKEEERRREEEDERRRKEEAEEEERRMEEERRREEEKEVRRREEKRRREEERRSREKEEERKKQEKVERTRKIEEEKMREEEEREERRRRDEEEERVQMEKEEARLSRMQEEERKKMEEERWKMEEEEERRKREEDKSRHEQEYVKVRREEAERKRREEEERVRREEGEQKIKAEEEERRKKEEEKRRKEAEIKRQEEEYRIRLEEEVSKVTQVEEQIRRQDNLGKEEKDKQIKVEPKEKNKTEQDEERKVQQEKETVRKEREDKRKRQEEARAGMLEEDSLLKKEVQQLEESRATHKKVESKEDRIRIEQTFLNGQSYRDENKKRAKETEEERRYDYKDITSTDEMLLDRKEDVGGMADSVPLEKPPSTDQLEDTSSSTPFEEVPNVPAELLSQTDKMSAFKPSPPSCAILTQPSLSPDPLLQPSDKKTPVNVTGAFVAATATQEMPPDPLPKKRHAPLPPSNQRVTTREDLARDFPNHAQTKTSHQDPPGREDPPFALMERTSAAPPAPDHLGTRSGPQSQSQGDQNGQKSKRQANDSRPKTSSILSQRLEQKTTPMAAFPTAPTTKDVPPSQSSTYHGQQPGGLIVARHSKGLAPSRPLSSSNERKILAPSTKDGPPNEVFVAKETTDALQKDCNSECKRSSLTALLAGDIPESIPPYQGEASISASNEDNAHCESQSNQRCPVQRSNEYDACQIQLKSLKKIRAPLPPAKPAASFWDQSSTNQNTDTSLKGQIRGKEVSTTKKGIPKPCHASPASPSSQPKLLESSGSRQQRPQKPEAVGSGHGLNSLLPGSGVGGSLGPFTAWGSGEEAGEKGEECAVTSRRPHPVKPLSTLEHQHIFNVPGAPNDTSSLHDGIQENRKAKDSSTTGPYSQLTKEELISLVIKQHEQLSVKDKKIAELERYIDNLLVRVIEESPDILMSLNSIKRGP